MRFYHGSASVLFEDDIIHPGEEVGLSYHGRSKHVYMTHTDFSLSEVDYVPSGIKSAAQFAVRSAVLWACLAADFHCEGQCGWATDHSEALASAMLPDCVKVYEVQPLGPLMADEAYDVDADSCRTTQAKIVKVLTDLPCCG